MNVVHLGDCVEVLKTLPDGSVDAVVTDPPAGIAFMGKGWDEDKGGRRQWIAWLAEIMGECLRVLKPGGHALVWALPRTSHWTATALEDAGFEVRDCLVHIFGSGFPKSLDVSKAIDKAGGAAREDKFEGAFERRCGPTENKKCATCGKWLVSGSPCQCPRPQDAPQTDAAKQWAGFGTALKPASEHWWLCRKPLVGTVANNVQAHGTGALNIDGCRVAYQGDYRSPARKDGKVNSGGAFGAGVTAGRFDNAAREAAGRWPPNILLSHTPDCGESCVEGCPVAELDRQQDGASRFFPVFRYQAKASRSERETGLHKGQKASHPTVKPVALMRWLVRLVAPPGGVVLDPFTGSGTTGVACAHEQFSFIGIEREPEYYAIADARIKHALQAKEPQAALFADEVA